MIPALPSSTLFPYTTLFRSDDVDHALGRREEGDASGAEDLLPALVHVLRRPVQLVAREALAAVGLEDQVDGVLLHQLLERSEEHTSELQSRLHLVCRLLLEK